MFSWLARNRPGGREGAAAAELALVLPILVIILFGLIEFGRLFHDFDVVAKGVRNAARYLAHIPSQGCADAGGGNVTWSPKATNPNAIAQTKEMATFGQFADGTETLRLASFTVATVNVSTPCPLNTDSLEGVYVGGVGGAPLERTRRADVTAVVNITFMFGELVIPGLSNLTMTVTHREPHIGD